MGITDASNMKVTYRNNNMDMCKKDVYKFSEKIQMRDFEL